MNDELLRQKYVVLKTNLYNLKDKLTRLNLIYDELNLAIKSMLLVDNSILNEDDFINICIVNNDIKHEISNVIIPMLDEKVN